MSKSHGDCLFSFRDPVLSGERVSKMRKIHADAHQVTAFNQFADSIAHIENSIPIAVQVSDGGSEKSLNGNPARNMFLPQYGLQLFGVVLEGIKVAIIER